MEASPVLGDVCGTAAPEVVAGCTDGNVYALWADGADHADGPIAQAWTCIAPNETGVIQVLSTPALCSLDGQTLDIIAGSEDGIYRINIPGKTYEAANQSRFPWPTFHQNNARTGNPGPIGGPCVSASLIGRVVDSSGVGVAGASVSIVDAQTGLTPAVSGRTETRPAAGVTAGNATPGDEANEGGFVINQLPPQRSYTLTISKTGYPTYTVTAGPVSTGKLVLANIVL